MAKKRMFGFKKLVHDAKGIKAYEQDREKRLDSERVDAGIYHDVMKYSVALDEAKFQGSEFTEASENNKIEDKDVEEILVQRFGLDDLDEWSSLNEIMRRVMIQSMTDYINETTSKINQDASSQFCNLVELINQDRQDWDRAIKYHYHESELDSYKDASAQSLLYWRTQGWSEDSDFWYALDAMNEFCIQSPERIKLLNDAHQEVADIKGESDDDELLKRIEALEKENEELKSYKTKYYLREVKIQDLEKKVKGKE